MIREPQPVEPAPERKSNGAPIHVRIMPPASSGKPFTQKWRMEGDTQWRPDDIELSEGYDHDLHFRFDKPGFRWNATAQQSFSARKSKGCPDPGEDGGGEIDFKRSTCSPQVLVIRDRNLSECDLTYALYFRGPNGPEKFDPVIKNTGGGPPY